MLSRFLALLGLLMISNGGTFADDELSGNWRGTARAIEETTGFVLHIGTSNEAPTASVSLPNIGVSRWPAHDIQINGDLLTMSLPSDSGPQEIRLRLEAGTLSGTWKDNALLEPSILTLSRDQYSPEFTEHRIHLQGTAGQIGVSYMLPDGGVGVAQGDSPVPAVVLLHGSGPIPRDANRFAAEAFVRRGIAAIFFDKRGVAETAGDFERLTFDQLAEDAISVALHFEQQSGIKSVGFWGHSQGGWIAPLAASRWNRSAFAIMSAGPAVSPAREAEWAYIYPVRNFPGIENVVPEIRALVRAFHDGLRTDHWDEFKRLSAAHADTDWYKSSGVHHLGSDVSTPFYESYRLYMDYDPVPTLAQLEKPLLAIFSPDDESIDSAESVEVLEAFLQNGNDITIVQYPGYNHSMRKIAEPGQELRFPNYPDGYFDQQADFIKKACGCLDSTDG